MRKLIAKLFIISISLLFVNFLISCKETGKGDWIIEDFIYKNETSHEVKIIVDSGYNSSKTKSIAPNGSIEYRSKNNSGDAPTANPKTTLIFDDIKQIDFDRNEIATGGGKGIALKSARKRNLSVG